GPRAKHQETNTLSLHGPQPVRVGVTVSLLADTRPSGRCARTAQAAPLQRRVPAPVPWTSDAETPRTVSWLQRHFPQRGEPKSQHDVHSRGAARLEPLSGRLRPPRHSGRRFAAESI